MEGCCVRLMLYRFVLTNGSSLSLSLFLSLTHPLSLSLILHTHTHTHSGPRRLSALYQSACSHCCFPTAEYFILNGAGIRAYMCVCARAYVCVRVYVCVCVCVRVHVRVCVRMGVSVGVCR